MGTLKYSLIVCYLLSASFSLIGIHTFLKFWFAQSSGLHVNSFLRSENKNRIHKSLSCGWMSLSWKQKHSLLSTLVQQTQANEKHFIKTQNKIKTKIIASLASSFDLIYYTKIMWLETIRSAFTVSLKKIAHSFSAWRDFSWHARVQKCFLLRLKRIYGFAECWPINSLDQTRQCPPTPLTVASPPPERLCCQGQIRSAAAYTELCRK